MNIVLSFGAAVVVSVRRHPIDRMALQRQGAAIREHIFQPLGRLERAVGQLPVVGQGDAKHSSDQIANAEARERLPSEVEGGREGAQVDDAEENCISDIFAEPVSGEVRARIDGEVPEVAVTNAKQLLHAPPKGNRVRPLRPLAP